MRMLSPGETGGSASNERIISLAGMRLAAQRLCFHPRDKCSRPPMQRHRRPLVPVCKETHRAF